MSSTIPIRTALLYWSVIRCFSRIGAYRLLSVCFATTLNILALKKALFIRRIYFISFSYRLDSNFTVKLSDGALSQEFFADCYAFIRGSLRPVKWSAIETLQEGLCTTQSNVVRNIEIHFMLSVTVFLCLVVVRCDYVGSDEHWTAAILWYP